MTPHRRPRRAPAHRHRREGRTRGRHRQRARGVGVVVDPHRLPVWNTIVFTFCPPSLTRLPTGKAAPELLHEATIVLTRSGSYRDIVVYSAPSSRPASSVTAANTFLRRRGAGHQRCHPSQRRLFPRDPVVAGSPWQGRHPTS